MGAAKKTFTRFAPAAVVTAGETEQRTSTFVLSTSEVGRDGHKIIASGWKLDAYRKNPVVLFAHNASALPIGRSRVWIQDGALYGEVAYAGEPFAQSVASLVREGVLNAASVSWIPIRFSYSTDRNRPPGAIDFQEQELMEWSIVPVPADANAIVTARRRGIAPALIAELEEVAFRHRKARARKMHAEMLLRLSTNAAPRF